MWERTLGPGEASVSDDTEMALEATVSSGPSGRGDRVARRGSTISRYVVLDLAGAGAMGLVLAAYDPQLDRKVAVKLLQVTQEAAQGRLQREAQALAKLGHPNVVGVYDVGTHDGQLFMAMEFVEGITLGKWMKQLDHPHPWREVVRVLSDAGRGLAAAHAAGLVHRDFKPENVMIGRDGRVRVMDFGLVRTTSLTEHDPDPDVVALSGSHRAEIADMTQTGAVMGTPAYMSPEQFEGKPADARSDQFGFCIALYEALYGERPFVDKSLAELLLSLQIARIKPVPPGSNVPQWLRKVVLRGLAPDPAQRWPSMDALLEALADDPGVRRRKWLFGSMIAGSLVLATAVLMLAKTDDGPSCAALDRQLEGVWDAARREQVEAAMLATKLSYAAGTWARVGPRLDAYASAWVDARTRACEATARGEQSERLLDLRMACLDRQLAQLRATVDALAEADATAVEHAMQAIEQLPSADACDDRQALLDNDVPRDPAVAQAVAQLDQRLVAGEALGSLGHPQRGAEAVASVVTHADALGDPATSVRARLLLGRLQRAAGEYQAAEVSLRESYRAAILADMPAEAAAAARALVELVGGGTGLLQPAEGRMWAFHAEALTEATGTPDDRAAYLMALGELDKVAGDHRGAKASFARALEIYEQLHADDHRVVVAITSLANVEMLVGDLEAARAHYQRALELLSRTRDATHPDVGRIHLSLGELAGQAGRWAEARTELELAVGVFEQALGPDYPALGVALATLGYVAGWQGDFPAGRRALERSVELLERSVGRDHYYYADAVGKLGALEFLAGDLAAAGEHYELARASLVRQMGPEHPSVGVALGNLAEWALAMGRFELALAHADAALVILAAKQGKDHVDLAFPLEIRGRALVELGRTTEAIEPLERALAIHDRERHDEGSTATLRAALARARGEPSG